MDINYLISMIQGLNEEQFEFFIKQLPKEIKLILHDKALIAAMEAEKKQLGERIASLEKKMESRNKFVANMCGGNKFVSSKVQASFRTSKGVVQLMVDGRKATEAQYKNFLMENNMYAYLKKSESYAVSKTAIKEALDKGELIPGASLVDSISTTIK